ncbi:MAG: hypothetical protein Q4C60_02455 [Eubacteriales bacterium]|nr:hypothetical protein [Eubacteriales bacterium]
MQNSPNPKTAQEDGVIRRLVENQRLFWNVHRISILLTVLYFASLIPLLVIAQYNYAGADDYSIGADCHAVWE